MGPFNTVTITGISETMTRRLSSHRRLGTGLSVTVGYQLGVDQSNPLAADKISQETGPLKDALQNKLNQLQIAVNVTEVSLPPPAMQVGCISTTTQPPPIPAAPPLTVP